MDSKEYIAIVKERKHDYIEQELNERRDWQHRIEGWEGIVSNETGIPRTGEI